MNFKLYKESYLLFIIVIGLVSLSLYSTYAMFTYSSNTEGNVIDMNINELSIDLSVNQYELITLNSNEEKVIDLNVINSMDSNLNYGIWYEMITPDTINDDIYIGYTNSTIDSAVGTINVSETKTAQIKIANFMEESITLKIGVAQASNSNLEIGTTQTLINTVYPNVLKDAILEEEINTTDIDFSMMGADFQENYEEISGLFMTMGKEKPIYFFRGRLSNNFVSFAGLDWQILRTNEDGSIRLILYNVASCLEESDTGYSSQDSCDEKNNAMVKYNLNSDDPKYLGYAYNTTTSNDTDSNIKTWLESWYDKNLKDYEDSIATTTYCNDTSISQGYFNAYYRYGVNPTYICPSGQDSNYGGEYNLKIGLPTIDELNYGGFDYAVNAYFSKPYFTMSPMMQDPVKLYSVSYDEVTGDMLGKEESPDTALFVRPVINLKPSVKFTSGNGDINNPYIVE